MLELLVHSTADIVQLGLVFLAQGGELLVLRLAQLLQVLGALVQAAGGGVGHLPEALLQVAGGHQRLPLGALQQGGLMLGHGGERVQQAVVQGAEGFAAFHALGVQSVQQLIAQKLLIPPDVFQGPAQLRTLHQQQHHRHQAKQRQHPQRDRL